MERDLRGSPLYREVEEHLPQALRAGFREGDGARGPTSLPRRAMGRVHGFAAGRSSRARRRRGSASCGRRGGFRSGRRGRSSSGPGHDAAPRWSPDGRRLGFRLGSPGEGPDAAPRPGRGRRGRGGGACRRSRGRSRTTRGRPTGRGSSCSPPVSMRTAPAQTAPGRSSPRRTSRLDPEGGLMGGPPGLAPPLGRRRRVGRGPARSRATTSTCGRRTGAVTVPSSRWLPRIRGSRAWYTAPLVLIDVANGEDRVLAKSDVQFGLPAGAPDGSRVAAIEAPCSDRQLVSGERPDRERRRDGGPARRTRRRGHHVGRVPRGRAARLHGSAARRQRLRAHRPVEPGTGTKPGRRPTGSVRGRPPPRRSGTRASRSCVRASTDRPRLPSSRVAPIGRSRPSGTADTITRGAWSAAPSA